jgi:hypothetical protein
MAFTLVIVDNVAGCFHEVLAGFAGSVRLAHKPS